MRQKDIIQRLPNRTDPGFFGHVSFSASAPSKIEVFGPGVTRADGNLEVMKQFFTLPSHSGWQFSASRNKFVTGIQVQPGESDQ
jgi:hypothetical protein